MAQQNVGGWFKFGFCKFKEHCRKKHVKEKCEDSKCKVKNFFILDMFIQVFMFLY